ncbi:hypothetical protein [Micromonospora carbonacea]|uniref:hypothetical protein n=1 Tax=Micromonospora carbonacea TaxID=47853 RepID=UPI00371B719E
MAGGPVVATALTSRSAVGDSPIRRLIEASSLGTPEARALAAGAPDEVARRIVDRASQIDTDEAWDAVTQAQGEQCAPYYCPTSGDVECCPGHSGWVVCCDRPDLHQPTTDRSGMP